MAWVEGTDFEWKEEVLTPGTGRIINIWEGLDPDESQDFTRIIKEMESRHVVKNTEIRMTFNVYCRVAGGSTAQNVANVITFDTYVKYLT